MFSLFKKKNPPKTVSNSAEKQLTKESAAPADILKAISAMQKELDRLKLSLTNANVTIPDDDTGQLVTRSLDSLREKEETLVKSDNEKVIEGVFDGESMIGADGQRYDVPANYASKSKLVEGDILKLTINNLGAFVYKQIKPIERSRLVGKLEQDFHNLQFYAVLDGKKWKLLTASVTYFKGEEGDDVVFLIPAEGGSKWAAVENIVKE